MARMVARLGVLALGLLGGPGCASFATHLSPRPTPPGELEVHASADVVAYRKDAGERVELPALELSVRYGLAPGIDLGGRVGPVYAAVDTRLGLVRSGGFELTVAPGLGFAAATHATGHGMALVGSVSLPMLAAVRLDRDLSMIGGVKLLAHLGRHQLQLAEGSGSTKLGDAELALYSGLLLGLEVALSENFALLPELTLLFPYLADYEKFARPVWQGGVSFQFHFPS